MRPPPWRLPGIRQQSYSDGSALGYNAVMKKVLPPTLLLCLAVAGCVSTSTHKEVIARADKLASEKADLSREKSELEGKLGNTANDLAALQTKYSTEMSALQSKYNSLTDSKTELSGKHEFAMSKLKDTEAKVQATEGEVAKLQSTLKGEQDHSREILGAHEFTKAKLKDTETRIAGLEQRLAGLRGDFTSYKTARDKERDDLKARWDIAKKSLATLNMRLTEVNAILADMGKQVTALEASKDSAIIGTAEKTFAGEMIKAAAEGSSASSAAPEGKPAPVTKAEPAVAAPAPNTKDD